MNVLEWELVLKRFLKRHKVFTFSIGKQYNNIV